MKVLLAEEYGFCVGVRMALKKLDQVIEEHPDKKVSTIGELIHNNDVIRQYQEKGVSVAGSIFDIGDGLGVVRAHGLPQSIIEEARKRGLDIIDATCPFVRKISKIIESEINSNVPIYLIAEPSHPEVIAATKDYSQYVDVIDYEKFDPVSFKFPVKKCIVLSQTTMSEKRFVEIAKSFIEHCDNTIIYNTICPSTRQRQKSALELAKTVDGMIILGGKNSSNTRRLFELCAGIVPSFHLERIEELEVGLIKGMKTVGLTAGASTPDWIIQEAFKLLEAIEPV